MQNLDPLLIFVMVAEMGSFTRAADSLGIQKGRASTAVRKLEEDVGVRLLHRTTRSVQLTEDGRAFHARARDLLAEVDDLHSMFASDRVALRGRLHRGKGGRSFVVMKAQNLSMTQLSRIVPLEGKFYSSKGG